MSIEKVRSSLNSDDLKIFDDIMYNVHLSNDIKHDIIDFNDVKNFIIKSTFQCPDKYKTGLVFFKDGLIAGSYCY